MIHVKHASVDLAKDRNGVARASPTRVRYQEVGRQPPSNPPARQILV
jgi:hypothetical protein